MNKEITEKKFSLTTITHLIKLVIILFLLFSNLYAADAQNTANSKDNNTAKYQGTISGDWSGKAKIRIYGTFSTTIAANGIVSGTFTGFFMTGTITGTVNSNGEMRAKIGSDIDFFGQLSVEGGRLSGSGTWERFSDEKGTWQSK
ncbi:MAG: hypothetical protein ACLPSL_01265 [Smithella sp.]